MVYQSKRGMGGFDTFFLAKSALFPLSPTCVGERAGPAHLFLRIMRDGMPHSGR